MTQNSSIKSLTSEEQDRLRAALRAAWAVPWGDDIVGFIWEAIFHYVKQLTIPDRLIKQETKPTQKSKKARLSEQQLLFEQLEPNDVVLAASDLTSTQISKRLYDAVDFKAKIGWSLKTLLVEKTTIIPGQEITFVIQRADIFTKYQKLGFLEELSKNSSTSDLGKAIIQHWNNKVDSDGQSQGVTDGRLAILVKNKDRQQYVYIEQLIEKFDATDFDWIWTDEKRRGLQARRKNDGKVLLRWYGSGTQLFQTVTIPENPISISITPKRAEVDKFVESVLESLS